MAHEVIQNSGSQRDVIELRPPCGAAPSKDDQQPD
jgi:hypothetical protein